jgi:S-adenosylmethionine-dependent methyltransferase
MSSDDPADDRWASLADRFVDGHYGSLRGRVRTHVINAHLRAHMPAPPLRVIDVGGGAGHQSIPLARAGYEVTVVDPSPAMLERAEQVLAEEAPEVARRISLVEAAGEEAPAKLGGQRFGGVLCHGVIMYLDDPAPMVEALSLLANDAAIVSIVAKNAQVLAARPALEGNWAAALGAFDTERQINGLGIDTRGDRIQDLMAVLIGCNIEPIDWYGVRLFTDGWTADRLGADPEDLVLAVELEASRRDPYRQLSRLFHLVGRRR